VIPIQAARVEGARLSSGDGTRVIERVVIDSREAGPGALFVALRGERTDGHAFLEGAAGAGCAAVLCEPGRAPALGDVAVLSAPSPLAALQALARQVRRRSTANVVGIAGSAGKTTTKDALLALCAPHARTLATEKNHNNELGVPLTLLRLEETTEIALCEMAMRASGEIAELAAIAEPDAALITNVGPEHLEFLGSVENVARTEAELLAQLPAGRLAVLPHDEPLLDPFRRSDLRLCTFGDDPGADVRPLRFEPGRAATRVELLAFGEHVVFDTNLRAPHSAANLAAAVAVYGGLGLPLDRVGEGAAQIQLSPWRGQERPRGRGGVVINDAYNANPLSMRAALGSLGQRAGGARSVAVLGEMAELGAEAPRFHREVGEHAAACGVDVLVGIGELARGYEEGAAGRLEAHWFAGQGEAAEALAGLLRPDDVVLLKASRAAGLEALDEAIA
jgi:UDP-N-acetylmuramoyl-tripeptide--D-alanyl-D-alanine ligase